MALYSIPNRKKRFHIYFISIVKLKISSLFSFFFSFSFFFFVRPSPIYLTGRYAQELRRLETWTELEREFNPAPINRDTFFPMENRESFLVAGTQLYNPLYLSVHPSIGQRLFYRILRRLFHICSCPNTYGSLFHYCPCPPTRDFGSHVYGLDKFSMCVLAHL